MPNFQRPNQAPLAVGSWELDVVSCSPSRPSPGVRPSDDSRALADKEGSMRDFSFLSRRDLLRMAGAAGGFAIAGVRDVWAQSAKKIESMAPELDRVISTSEPIRELATGYGGDIGPAEGPVWWAEGRYLLFNDINSARRIKYTPGQSASVAMEKTNEANGMTRDLKGRVVSAGHLTRRTG